MTSLSVCLSCCWLVAIFWKLEFMFWVFYHRMWSDKWFWELQKYHFSILTGMGWLQMQWKNPSHWLFCFFFLSDCSNHIVFLCLWLQRNSVHLLLPWKMDLFKLVMKDLFFLYIYSLLQVLSTDVIIYFLLNNETALKIFYMCIWVSVVRVSWLFFSAQGD